MAFSRCAVAGEPLAGESQCPAKNGLKARSLTVWVRMQALLDYAPFFAGIL